MHRFNFRIIILLGILFCIILGIILEQASKTQLTIGTKEISILIDAGPRDQVFWENLKKSFESDNPDIVVKFIRTTQEEKVMTMIAGGVTPDILLVPGEKFLAYLMADAMLDITDFIKRDSLEMDLPDVYPITRQPFTFEKRIYGLPYSICPFVLFFNRDLFRKYNVPFPDSTWTWNDMTKAAKKLTRDTDKDGVIDEFGLSMNLWADPLYSFIFQNGGKVLSDDGKKVEMDNPKTIEAVQFIYDLIHKDLVVQTTFNKSKSRATFKDGKTAMLSPGGIFWLPEFRFYENLDFDIAPLPSGTNGRASTIVPIGYAIYSKTKYPEESFRLLKYLNGKKAQEILAKTGLFLSCRKSINHSEYFLKPVDPNTGKEYKYPKHIYNAIKDIEDGHGLLPQYSSLRWWLVLNLINEKFDDLFYNPARQDKTPESVCKEVSIKGNEIIQIADEELKGTEIPWDLVLGLLAFTILLSLCFVLFRSYFKTKNSKLNSYENKWGYALISPWIIGFIVFMLGPILVSIFLSFCRWSALNPPQYARFIGLQNYGEMFTNDPKFIKSLVVTSYYTILSVPLGLIAGILLALLMNLKLKGMNYFRVIYFLPAILPSVAVTVLWASIFRKDGILNYIFLSIYNNSFGLIFGQTNYSFMPDWLGNADFTIPALVIMNLWAVGGGMMIYLAGLQGISPELYEAAEIDGAGPWKKFWRITLPQLTPVIFFNLIMGIIGSFQVFNQAYVLFGMSGEVGRGYGGPEDSALFYVLQLYHKAFKEFQVGYASSLAWILFIIILIFTLLIFKSSPLWVYYEGKKN